MEHISAIKQYFADLTPAASLIFTAPFAILLGCIAILPLRLPHFWESNANKGKVAAALALPVFLFFLARDWHVLATTFLDYLAFIALLGALFTISGGIYIQGSFAGLPSVNAVFLLLGALLSNLIGTTGASMLLIRPLLRANHERKHKSHIVIFFIFIVSNTSGLLTPLGDPPLFLGFLKGVDFIWTLRLFKEWIFVLIALLTLFYLLDHYYFKKEHQDTHKILKQMHGQFLSERFSILGKRNFIFLAMVIGTILFSGYVIYPMDGPEVFGESWGGFLSKVVQMAGMLAAAVASYRMTPRNLHEKNNFGFGPIIEVAVLFSGIFVTMMPALLILETQGGKFGITHSWQYFWMSGVLSSFLDNAPTYLTFTSLAKGALNIPGEGLAGLMHHPQGSFYLAAVSCGSVFMGANTYIGNGPNFMVKAIAEHARVKMPGFFGYMAWSVGVLIPVFILVTFLFFGRG